MSDAKERLDDLLTNGICNDIYRGEQAMAMFLMIAHHAPAINQATFGEFFGTSQQIFLRQAVLSVANLFERPGSRYPNRGIPSVLDLLEANAVSLQIAQRSELIHHLGALGLQEQLGSLTDSDLTLRTVQFFRDHLLMQPSITSALDRVRTLRNKAVAHNEAIAFETLPRPTIDEFSGLVTLAQQFLKAIGRGYLSVYYGQPADGDYIMSSDAERAAICLSRVLVASGVIDSETAKKARMTLHKD